MPVPHYIRGNKAVIAPNRFICLDTEAHRETTAEGGEVQTWRLAVTSYDHRRTAAHPWAEPVWVRHATPEALWGYVDGRVRQHGRTIVFAHNMGYDVRISRALTVLPGLGWKVERWQVSDRGCVIRMRNQVRSLWLVDAFNWFPISLERVGGLLALPKAPLPGNDEDSETWWARCEQDVRILRTAIVDMFSWVEEDQLGNWQATAGAMAWAEWRHRHYTHKVLVHDNAEARAAERDAAYTGRCEAWRHGRLTHGRWYEYDMPLCYARVAQSVTLPTILQWHVTRPSVRTVCRNNGKDLYLVRATVKQSEPVLPQRFDGLIRWPIGEVTGWYWDVELIEAAKSGAVIEVHEGWRYYGTPALKDWADWIIPYVEDKTGDIPQIRQSVAKVWARALIGKFATRYVAYDKIGDSIDPEMGLEDLVDLDTGAIGRFLQVGGEAFTGLELTDGTETAPAIMSYIMAVARCRLWTLMQSAGLENVAYCDTDSVIVSGAGRDRLNELVASGGGWGVRDKSHHDGMIVYGPRQLAVAGVARMAGLPRHAEQVEPGKWVGEVWESLNQSIATGNAGQVVIGRRSFTPGAIDNRRRHLDDGATGPYSTE